MDWKQFIAHIVENVSWPLTTLAVLFMLRGQVGSLIEKIGHLKYKDFELEFDKLKSQADSITKQENTVIEFISDSETNTVFSSLEEQILDTVETAPPAAILLAWSVLETALSSAVARLAISPDPPSYRSPIHNIEHLEREGEVSPQQIKLLHDMRVLRNKIAHEQSSALAIGEERALEYAATAIEMMGYLNNLKRDRKAFLIPRGEWTDLPENFKELKRENTGSVWIYTYIKIPGSDLTAGLGPWADSFDKDSATFFDFFSIDIERDKRGGSEIITELKFELDYVDPTIVKRPARELIQYDSVKKTVTFDLGKSQFVYRIDEGAS